MPELCVTLVVPIKRLDNVTSLALKLPDTSRATMAEAVFKGVAVVAVLATFPDDEMIANFVSTIPAAASMSALTIKDVDNAPDAELCTIPVVVKLGKETIPVADARLKPVPKVVFNCNIPELCVRLVVPIKRLDKVTLPALKLPDPSRATMAKFVLLGVAVVAELATLPDEEIICSLSSEIVLVVMSAFTIKLDVKAPVKLL